ncbi:MAG TPA: hypothetical protein VFW12_00740 [Candidatus Limnocylindria bacterium]|nr:hypothetical protein [Candidatus Limnocylindria bacterium]
MTARDLAGLLLLVATIALLGIADYVTGPYGFSLFYLIPIALGAWYVGAPAGIALAAAAALTWLMVDLSDSTPDRVLPSAWNGFTRLVIFGSVALLLAVLRQRERQAGELERFQGHLLELVDRELPGRLDRLRRVMTRPGGRGQGSAAEITTSVDDLVLLTNRVVALSLVASGSSRGTADVSAVVRECVRVTGDRDRVVLGDLRPARVAISARVLRFVLAGLIVAALRTTNGYVRISARADADGVALTVTVDRATAPVAERDMAGLLNSIATAREVLQQFTCTLGVGESDGATNIEIRLRAI